MAEQRSCKSFVEGSNPSTDPTLGRARISVPRHVDDFPADQVVVYHPRRALGSIEMILERDAGCRRLETIHTLIEITPAPEWMDRAAERVLL